MTISRWCQSQADQQTSSEYGLVTHLLPTRLLVYTHRSLPPHRCVADQRDLFIVFHDWEHSMDELLQYIDGEWRRGSGGEPRPNRNPARASQVLNNATL